MYFPGATTKWESRPAASPTAWAQEYAAKAQQEAAWIASEITRVREAADALAEATQDFFVDASSFSIPTTNIAYNPPAYAQPSLYGQQNGVEVGEVPTLAELASVELSPFSLVGSTYPKLKGSLTTSAAELPDFSPVEPPESGTRSPPSMRLELFTPPEYSVVFDEQSIAEYTPDAFPAAPEVNLTIGDFITPVALSSAPPDLSSLDARLASLQDRMAGFRVVPEFEYEPLDTTAAELVGNMLNGETDFSNSIIESGRARHTRLQAVHDTILLAAVQRYGAPDQVTAAGSHLDRRRDRTDSEQQTREEALAAKFRLDILEAGVQLASQLYVAQLQRRQQIIDAEVGALEQRVEAAREIIKAIAAGYQAAVRLFRARIQGHSAGYEIEVQRASFHRSVIRKATAVGQIGEAEYRAYGISEAAKTLRTERVRQIVASNRARAAAYAGRQRARATLQTVVVESTAAKQQMALAEWSADLESLVAHLEVYKGRAALVTAENSAKRARQGIVGANYGRAEAEAQRTAAGAARLLEETNEELIEQRAAFARSTTANQLYEAASRASAVHAMLESTEEQTNYAIRTDGMQPRIAANQEAAGFFAKVSEALGRAAALTQDTNVKLAEAYASVQEQLGRAYAAVNNGKLSGWSAASTLSAQGGLRASTGASRTQATSRGTSVSQSQNESSTTSIGG